MHLNTLLTLFAVALLSACSSGEDLPAPEASSTPTPVIASSPPAASKTPNSSSAHQENGLPPVIEQF